MMVLDHQTSIYHSQLIKANTFTPQKPRISRILWVSEHPQLGVFWAPARPILDVRHSPFNFRAWVLIVLQLASQVVLVGGEVEMAVAAEVEQNDLGAALFPRRQRFVDGGADGRSEEHTSELQSL